MLCGPLEIFKKIQVNAEIVFKHNILH